MQRPLIITCLFILVFMCVSFFVYYWFAMNIREGLEQQKHTYTYMPNKNLKNQRKDDIHVHEFTHEAALAIDFIKVDSKLVAEKDSKNTTIDTTGEYSKTYTDLDIYKEFKPSDYTKNLDRKYGKHFDGDVISKLSDAEIESKWNSDMESYNKIYNFVYYSTMNPAEKYDNKKFSRYFTGLLIKYKSKKEQLGEIKKFFSSLIKPIYLSNTVLELYLNNEPVYDRVDKDTKDSTLFAINTVYEYVSQLTKTVADDFPIFDTDDYVYCFKEDQTDKTFTLDSIKVFQAVGVLLEVKTFVEKIKNKKKIDMSVEKFVSGFQEFLLKANHVADDQKTNASNQSSIIYVLDHPVVENAL